MIKASTLGGVSNDLIEWTMPNIMETNDNTKVDAYNFEAVFHVNVSGIIFFYIMCLKKIKLAMWAKIVFITVGVLVAVVVLAWLCLAPFYILNHIPPPIPQTGSCGAQKVRAKAGDLYYGQGVIGLGIATVTINLCVTVEKMTLSSSGGSGTLKLAANAYGYKIEDVSDLQFTYDGTTGTISLTGPGAKLKMLAVAIKVEESHIKYDKCSDSIKMLLKLSSPWNVLKSYITATLLKVPACPPSKKK